MRALSAGNRRLTNSSAPTETSRKLSFMLPLRSSITIDRDRLRLGREERDRLELAVVVDLEVVFGEIGHQPAGRVGHRRIDRDRARAASERCLLLAGNRRAQCCGDAHRRHDIPRSERGASERAHLGAHREIPLEPEPVSALLSAGLRQGRHSHCRTSRMSAGVRPPGRGFPVRRDADHTDFLLTGRGSRAFLRRDADLADFLHGTRITRISSTGRGSRGFLNGTRISRILNRTRISRIRHRTRIAPDSPQQDADLSDLRIQSIQNQFSTYLSFLNCKKSDISNPIPTQEIRFQFCFFSENILAEHLSTV